MQAKDVKRKIIDIHAHAFPDDLSERALSNMEKAFRIKARCGGRVSDLISRMDEAGIDLSVLQGVALKPEQVPSINTWMGQIQSDRIRCFGAMHPLYDRFEEELERVKAMGFWGIKFQPEFQDFWPDEERMFPFYKEMEKLKLGVLFHAGCELSRPGVIHASPERIRSVHDRFPGLLLIAGHFGGYRVWDGVERHLVGTGVLFDTACVFGDLDSQSIRRIIYSHGADKILFGSDHPLFSSREGLEGIKSLNLSEHEEDLVLGGNAWRLFGAMVSDDRIGASCGS
ncbi:MAG: amidohydrolase family protein [Candidatus Aureabacteria bacterium]|nr:amidohydrolase family protein [Candidatus Auribacterota bacterium]